MLSVEGELNSKISQIFANTMEGYVRIEGGTIAIADDPDAPSHLILINHYGIAFMNKEDNPGWPTQEDIEIFTEKNSAWTIDGSLDMNFINVDEIEATYIKNENLVLGNHDNRLVDGLNTVDAGDLDIYDKNGHLMFETITEHLDGYPDNAVWIKGFRIHTYNVQKDGDSYENSAWSPDGYIELSCENGFGEYDISNNLIYGNKDNKWFARISQTNKQIISSVDSNNVEYGIQIIPMTLTTDDGVKHKLKERGENAKFLSYMIQIKSKDGKHVVISGLNPDRAFKSGEEVERGEILGKIHYCYKKIAQPCIRIGINKYEKVTDPMTPFGLKSTYIEPVDTPRKQTLTHVEAEADYRQLASSIKEIYPSFL